MFSALWFLPSLIAVAYAYLKIAMCAIKNEEFLQATLAVMMLVVTAIAALSLIGTMATYASMLIGIVSICVWHAMTILMVWSAEKEYVKTFNKPSTVFSFFGRVREVTRATPEKVRSRVAVFRSRKTERVVVSDPVATTG